MTSSSGNTTSTAGRTGLRRALVAGDRGGNIKNIALNAAFPANAAGGGIRTEHVLAAVRHKYDTIDKLVTPSEFGPYYKFREKT